MQPIHELPLAETDLSDTAQLHKLMNRLLALDVPGFVIRQVNVPRPHGAVLQALAPVFDPQEIFSFSLTSFEPDQDVGPHYDNLNGSPDGRQVTFHYTTRGACGVRLSTLLPEIRDRASHGRNFSRSPEFAEGNVDPTIVSPVVHTTNLTKRDMLLFADADVVHDFRTTEAPRFAECVIHHIPLPETETP